MGDWRTEHVGTVTDANGEQFSIGILYPADPEEGDEPQITIGTEIELDQDGAEAFARVFVSACWEAARKVPGDG